MTNNFNGTVLVVSDTTRVSVLADRIAATYYPESKDYHYVVTESTPEGLPADLHDQISAKLRDNPGDSVVTVYPWANN